jgi:cell division inhibitor SepF
MIPALLRAAALVLVATLVAVAPVLGEPSDAAAAQGVGGDLRSEYPLRDAKRCCSSSPAPAATVHQPGPNGSVDGEGGLTLWMLAIALASCLALAWLVRSRPEEIPRVDLSRAAAIAGAIPRAVRGVDFGRVTAIPRGVPRAVRGIDVSRVTAVARAVPRVARKVDLRAVIPSRDRPHRDRAAAPELEPSGGIEKDHPMDDEAPTPARRDQPPERHLAAAGDAVVDPAPPVQLDPPHYADTRTPEHGPSASMEEHDPMDDEAPTPARRDPPPERHLAAAGERPAVPPPPVQLVAPRSFAEVEAIRDGFIGSTAVVLDLRSTEPELANGLTYFASGFTFGLGGAMRELAADLYLLTPRDVSVSAEESTRLLASLLPAPKPGNSAAGSSPPA